MFSNAKVGDRVWSVANGWGTIIRIDLNRFPIVVDFTNSVRSCYTKEGIFTPNDAIPSLFWNEFEIPEEAYIRPLPKLDVDTKVLVWDGLMKCRRYFSHFNEHGKIVCFDSGTSWSNNGKLVWWSNWELYKE